MSVTSKLISTVLSLLIIFLSYVSYSQAPSFKIKGKIADESDGTPLEFATIAVKKLRDSSLVSGTITDASGNFELDGLPPGAMEITIAFIGYEQLVKKVMLRPGEAPPVTDLGTIKLKVSAKLLEGAEISAEKSFVINQIDKKTYNTDQLSVASGGNVKDILENIPSIEVDIDGNVSLRGNVNVTILIDGRPSGLTESGGKSLLESIPSSAIENIEVITNPSAKYDPDGISGIINIVTKKNKLQGFTGNAGLNTSFENGYGGNISLAYKKGKWNLYSLYGYNHRKRESTGYRYNENYFNNTVDYLNQDERETDDGKNQNVKTGVDYYLNDKNTISFSGLINWGDDDEEGIITYKEFDNNYIQDSIYKRTYTGSSDDINFDFDVNWKHFFKQKGRTIDFLVTGSVENDLSDNIFEQKPYINENTPYPGLPESERDNEENNNTTYTSSIDYEHPIGEDKKIEAGYKSTFREFDTDYNSEFFNESSGVYENDTNKTNQFIYNDQLHAVYAQFRQSINKFGYQIGIRSEYATTESKLVTTNENFNKDYFSVYPSAFVTYNPNKKTQFKINYSRRINRPSRRVLNPFSNYEDPLNIRKGNPDLDPEYTDSYELEFSRNLGDYTLIATGYARLTNDYIQRYRQVTPEGITITTFENLSYENNYGLELIFNGSPYKWWNFTFSGNIYKTDVDASNLESNLSSSSLAASARVFTTIKLPYGTSFQISYFYRAPNDFPQGRIKTIQSGTVALSKKLMRDKGLLTFRLNDPLNTGEFRLEYEASNYFQEFSRKRKSRIFNISFTYRFGELRDRDRQRRDQGPREEMDFEG